MRLKVDGVNHNQPIAEQFAFGVVDATTHVKLGANRNPGLSWDSLPDNTRSLVLVCVDSDVPTKPDDVNQENRLVPADLPRANFYHWVMVDIPPTTGGLKEGECSNGVTPGGKDNPPGPAGSRQGLNDYTGWFEGDADMGGQYFGYDGPCPPWNDSIVHHYHFVLYATDLGRCPVEGAFTGADVERALEGHVLSEVQITGTYTLNPDISP
ncbi:MAG: YbhB/YbcL family Raf kinase inhibitor-like protein [Gammaproteobacteria bacterium]